MSKGKLINFRLPIITQVAVQVGGAPLRVLISLLNSQFLPPKYVWHSLSQRKKNARYPIRERLLWRPSAYLPYNQSPCGRRALNDKVNPRLRLSSELRHSASAVWNAGSHLTSISNAPRRPAPQIHTFCANANFIPGPRRLS